MLNSRKCCAEWIRHQNAFNWLFLFLFFYCIRNWNCSKAVIACPVHFYSIFRGKPVHLTTNEDSDATAPDEEPSVIVQLSNRVQDGTRCRIGSLDMCIQGKCQVCSIYRC